MEINRPFRLASIILTLLAAIYAAMGCANLQDLTSQLQKPTARISSLGIKNLGLDAATLLFNVEVANPYSIPLPLSNLDYNLASGGTSFLSGKADIQSMVPSLGRKTISLPIQVRYAETLAALRSIRPGSLVPYESELGLSVNPPAGSRLRLPVRKSGQLPIPAPPQVSLTSIQWDQMNLQKVSGLATLRMVNPNQFPFNLSILKYALNLGNTEVANSSLQEEISFDPNGDGKTIQIPLSFSPAQLGMSLLTVVAGKDAGYSLRGSAEGSTPFGPLSLPIEKTGKTIFSH